MTPPWGTPTNDHHGVKAWATAGCVGAQAASVVAMMVYAQPYPWVFGALLFGLGGFMLSRGAGPERESRGE